VPEAIRQTATSPTRTKEVIKPVSTDSEACKLSDIDWSLSCETSDVERLTSMGVIEVGMDRLKLITERRFGRDDE
jgi:hypothetical protein